MQKSTNNKILNLTLSERVNHSGQSDPAAEQQAKALRRLAVLEANYAKIEADQMRQIKQLKNVLKERNLRQTALGQQMAQLVSQLKIQQEEIQKVTKQLTEVQQQPVEPPRKKNSSPGIIKKSLQAHKKVAGHSPSSHAKEIANTLTLLNKKEPSKSDTQGITDTIKRPSSGSNSKKTIKLVPKEMVTNDIIQPKKKNHSPLFRAIDKQNKNGSLTNKQNSSPTNKQNSSPTNKQNSSPTHAKNSSPLLFKRKQGSPKNALKLAQLLGKPNSEKAIPNGSPKKNARVSPGLQPRKKLLANIKQSMEEQAF